MIATTTSHIAACLNARIMPAISLLALVAAHTRLNGWVSRAQAKTSGQKAGLDALLTNLRNGSAEEPAQEDVALAVAALEYVRSINSPKRGFEADIVNLLAGDTVADYQQGVAAAAVGMYLRTKEVKCEGAGRFIGAEGEKITASIRVERIIPMNGYMPGSTSYLHIMRDGEGNKIVWKCSGNPLDDNYAGGIKGTIKKLESRDGVNETHLERVKATNDPAPVAPAIVAPAASQAPSAAPVAVEDDLPF